jgi:hypothetical protein
MYEFHVFSLIVLHPILYPGADTPFPADSSINDQTLNDLALAKKKVDLGLLKVLLLLRSRRRT